MRFMENMNPSQSSSTQQPDSGTKETLFAQAIVHLTKQQYIQLKWNSRYWQRQHERAITREAALNPYLTHTINIHLKTICCIVKNIRVALHFEK